MHGPGKAGGSLTDRIIEMHANLSDKVRRMVSSGCFSRNISKVQPVSETERKNYEQILTSAKTGKLSRT